MIRGGEDSAAREVLVPQGPSFGNVHRAVHQAKEKKGYLAVDGASAAINFAAGFETKRGCITLRDAGGCTEVWRALDVETTTRSSDDSLKPSPIDEKLLLAPRSAWSLRHLREAFGCSVIKRSV